MKDWLTKFHADGVYFHVAPPAQAAHSPAAGDVKVADHPIASCILREFGLKK
jgi:hypothetical protein